MIVQWPSNEIKQTLSIVAINHLLTFNALFDEIKVALKFSENNNFSREIKDSTTTWPCAKHKRETVQSSVAHFLAFLGISWRK